MRLNRFLASTGISSRRKADELIFDRHVKINGKIVTTPGIEVSEQDRIEVNHKTVKTIKDKIYLAVNKPVGVVSTCHDPYGKTIILDLLRKTAYDKHRNVLKPVGRLDQNTSGVILLTNDGELHHHLTHPSKECIKEYEVELSGPLPLAMLRKLRAGIMLEDGFIKPDKIDYLNSNIKHIITIRLHSGRNRIIRRMVEYVGATIKTLRRTNFAGVTLHYVLRKAGKRAFKHSDGVVVSLSTNMVENLKKTVQRQWNSERVQVTIRKKNITSASSHINGFSSNRFKKSPHSPDLRSTSSSHPSRSSDSKYPKHPKISRRNPSSF